MRPAFLSLTYLYNWFYSIVTYSELNICVLYFSYDRVLSLSLIYNSVFSSYGSQTHQNTKLKL